jgi:hypothetical protein
METANRTERKSKGDVPGQRLDKNSKGGTGMKAMEMMKKSVTAMETAGLRIGIRLHDMGIGIKRNKRGLSTVETIALTVVVVGAVVGAATILNPKLNDLIGRAFDKIAENLGL